MPVVPLDENTWLLELFHGPTAAFKDFGARFLACALAELRPDRQRLTILVATSGDTGSAVAHAFDGVHDVHVVVLYPANKVSRLQEAQLTAGPPNAHAVRIADSLMDRYVSGEIDEVVLVNSEFVSTMTQTPRSERLLPVSPEAVAGAGDGKAPPYEIEPDAVGLLEVLLPKALTVAVFRALLENQAGEHAARMAAMESATRNTEEMIERLTLQYNRARQASITRELVEIVSGAEAL